jgi:hypothetical protein
VGTLNETVTKSGQALEHAQRSQAVRGSIEAQRRNGLLLTRRWRELDSNLRFRARAGSILPVRFVADSLLDATGFEPSVPLFAKKGLSAIAGRTDKLDGGH